MDKKLESMKKNSIEKSNEVNRILPRELERKLIYLVFLKNYSVKQAADSLDINLVIAESIIRNLSEGEEDANLLSLRNTHQRSQKASSRLRQRKKAENCVMSEIEIIHLGKKRHFSDLEEERRDDFAITPVKRICTESHYETHFNYDHFNKSHIRVFTKSLSCNQNVQQIFKFLTRVIIIKYTESKFLTLTKYYYFQELLKMLKKYCN